jgi:hypothetical protein
LLLSRELLLAKEQVVSLTDQLATSRLVVARPNHVQRTLTYINVFLLFNVFTYYGIS